MLQINKKFEPRIDDFDEVQICYVDLKGVSKELLKQAQQIDTNFYSEECFQVCVNYIVEENQFYIISEEVLEGIYYIDEYGNKHYMYDEGMTEGFKNELFDYLKSFIKKEI